MKPTGGWLTFRQLSNVLYFTIVGVLVFYPLMVPPILGLADNGDFNKVSLGWALESPRENEYHYVSRVYQHVEEHRWSSGFWSSEHLLTGVAIALDNVLFQHGPSFDIRALGVVHGAFFLAAIAIYRPLPVPAPLARRNAHRPACPDPLRLLGHELPQ